MQEIPEPGTFEEAFGSPHAKEWKLAADSEYQSLIDNDTWDLVELPQRRTAVGCKWIFKVKYNGEGKVERFKSRLVAKGYSQRHGIDYEETFSPVVRFSSIQTLLTLAVQKDMIVHQMDVATAFLNGELDKEIYRIAGTFRGENFRGWEANNDIFTHETVTIDATSHAH